MAYELSEAFYAGLSLVDTDTLMEAKTNSETFLNLYQTTVNNFSSDFIKDGAGNSTKRGMLSAISVDEPTQQLYSDLAVGISAVLGTRKLRSSAPQAIYLTGNQWHPDVEQFQVKAFGMKEYNSSDIILRYGNEFVGISLKKKPKENAPSPTLINNSFGTFIAGKELRRLQDKINDVRTEFFANVIVDGCRPGNPLSDIADEVGVSKIKLNSKSNVKKIWDLKVDRIKSNGKVEKIPLINLKGVEEFSTGVNNNIGNKRKEAFRKFVNEKLQSKGRSISGLYQGFLDVMNDPEVKDTIADSLLNKVLKLKLFDELDTWKTSEFAFFTVEGVGTVNKNNEPNIGQATSINLTSSIVAIAMLAKMPVTLVLDSEKTFQRKAAKVFFTLFKGDYDILDIELRYKGSFTAMPQFFATTTNTFKKLVKDGEKAIA